MRVALLFDNTLRPETTGIYCRRALGSWSRLAASRKWNTFCPPIYRDWSANADDGIC